jgi:hypothetical protein
MANLTLLKYIPNFYLLSLLFGISLLALLSLDLGFSIENYNPKEKKTDIEP